MKSVFVDTAALIALGDNNDRFHFQALEVRNELKKYHQKFVTTNAVILELASYFSPSNARSSAIALIEAIDQSLKWDSLIIDDSLMKRGLELYKRMSDKDWSLVDCIGMIVARDLDITEIFTTDHHFEQAGFIILIKDE